MAPRIKMRMNQQTRDILKMSRDMFTVGELSFSAGIGADIIAEEARRRAPLGPTGNLKRSIVARINKTATQFGRVGSAYVGVDHKIAPHAHLVEYGGRGGQMPAQPFIRPAVDIMQSVAMAAIETDLYNRISMKLK